jgi:D-3-phosphoglycerate dehydrogenase / 2-oxoglutarate reductase
MKIVIAEKISPAAVELFRDEDRWTLVTPEQIEGKLAAHLPDADALIVRSAVKVDARVLEPANKLRVIGRAGVGVDNIDLDAATKKGIAVMNTPGANAVAVAEHTLGMMLAMAHHLSRADALMHVAKWEKKALLGSELRGKTLGIVGLGRVGMEVAKRARAFQMTVIAHDPFVSTSVARDLEIRMASLEDIYATADYITLHVGLTPQTANMINAETIRKMKRGVRLVNCARGELIDEPALAAALKLGHVAAAGLDVFHEEPLRRSPFTSLENVVMSPHIAGSTTEAQEAVGYQIALQVKEYLKHGVIQNAVNIPSVSHEEYLEMQPYIVLAERLGSFLAQAADGNAEEVAVRYSGPMVEWKTDLLRNAALKGILNYVLSEQANLVNAAAIASERGIKVREIKKSRTHSGGAANVLSVTLKTTADEHLVRGTVLHEKLPRLLAVDDIDVEAPLEHNLVYMRNLDVPGVIGKIGTILGAHQINIANFSLGRREKEGKTTEAIAVVHVDSTVREEVLNELRQVPAVKVAKAMTL